MSDGLELITETLGHRVAWTYLSTPSNQSRDRQGGAPGSIRRVLCPAKGQCPAGRSRYWPTAGRLFRRGGSCRATRSNTRHDVLMRLGLLIVDPSIRPQVLQVSRTEYGVHQLECRGRRGRAARAGVVNSMVAGRNDGPQQCRCQVSPSAPEPPTDRASPSSATLAQIRWPSFLRRWLVCARRLSLRLDDDDRALFELLAPDLKILEKRRLAESLPCSGRALRGHHAERAIEIFEVTTRRSEPDHWRSWIPLTTTAPPSTTRRSEPGEGSSRLPEHEWRVQTALRASPCVDVRGPSRSRGCRRPTSSVGA